MDLKLGGRKVLVTYSTSGIGAGIAQVLAREGALVVIHGRSEEPAKAVAERSANYVCHIVSPFNDFMAGGAVRIDAWYGADAVMSSTKRSRS